MQRKIDGLQGLLNGYIRDAHDTEPPPLEGGPGEEEGEEEEKGVEEDETEEDETEEEEKSWEDEGNPWEEEEGRAPLAAPRCVAQSPSGFEWCDSLWGERRSDFDDREGCRVGASYEGEGWQAGGRWGCTTCTLLNEADASACSACERPRDDDTPPDQRRHPRARSASLAIANKPQSANRDIYSIYSRCGVCNAKRTPFNVSCDCQQARVDDVWREEQQAARDSIAYTVSMMVEWGSGATLDSRVVDVRCAATDTPQQVVSTAVAQGRSEGAGWAKHFNRGVNVETYRLRTHETRGPDVGPHRPRPHRQLVRESPWEELVGTARLSASNMNPAIAHESGHVFFKVVLCAPSDDTDRRAGRAGRAAAAELRAAEFRQGGPPRRPRR